MGNVNECDGEVRARPGKPTRGRSIAASDAVSNTTTVEAVRRKARDGRVHSIPVHHNQPTRARHHNHTKKTPTKRCLLLSTTSRPHEVRQDISMHQRRAQTSIRKRTLACRLPIGVCLRHERVHHIHPCIMYVYYRSHLLRIQQSRFNAGEREPLKQRNTQALLLGIIA